MASDTKAYARINACIDAIIKSPVYADISADIPYALTAEIEGVTGRGVADVILENGEIIFVMSDGERISIGKLPVPEIPTASSEVLGGIKVGENLVIDESGTLSASAVQEVIKDDDRPVSGGAVYEIVGEVENILSDV